jgi:hypothetical protein
MPNHDNERCYIHGQILPCAECQAGAPCVALLDNLGKPDAELAAQFRAELTEALQPLLAICTRAKAAGFVPQFGVAFDASGRYYVSVLQLTKVY